MAKLTRRDFETMEHLMDLTTDQFLRTAWHQWDRIGNIASTIIAQVVLDGIDPEHEEHMLSLMRIGVRCGAMKRLIETARDIPGILAAFEPSDTDLLLQLDEVVKKADQLREKAEAEADALPEDDGRED